MAALSQGLAEIGRHERGRVVATLMRGLGSIDAAEEAFQEAVLAALSSWRNGLPANPAGRQSRQPHTMRASAEDALSL